MIVLCSADNNVRRQWKKAFGGNVQLCEVASMGELSSVLDEESSITLLHTSLPGLDGTDGIFRIKKSYPDSKLMVFADNPSDEEGVELLLHGAIYGYTEAEIPAGLLPKAIEAVQSGEIWVGRKLMQKLLLQLHENSLKKAVAEEKELDLSALTRREREIAQLVSKGASNKRIAIQLDVTERTVKAHLSSVFRKTGMRDRLQLALLVSGSK